MKKLNTLTLLLSVVLLHACTPKTECDKAKWHKYAIEAYYVPNYVYVAKAERSEDPSKLYWNLWFSRSEESSITEKTNKELFEKIAREHGETGVGFYAFLPCYHVYMESKRLRLQATIKRMRPHSLTSSFFRVIILNHSSKEDIKRIFMGYGPL